METGELLLMQVLCTAAKQDPLCHQHSPTQTISSLLSVLLTFTLPASTLTKLWAILPRNLFHPFQRKLGHSPKRLQTRLKTPANQCFSLMKQHIALPTVLCSAHLSKRQETCLTLLIWCQPHKLGKNISSEILRDLFHHLKPLFFRIVMWSHKYSLSFKSLSPYTDVYEPWKWRVRK